MVPFPFHLPTQPVLAVTHHQCHPPACNTHWQRRGCLAQRMVSKGWLLGDFSVIKAFV